MIKLIATDMDGTFLDSHKNFDKEFLTLFYQLRLKGIHFAIASGNQYYRLYQKFIPMSSSMYFIGENGSYIAKGEKRLYTNTMTKEKTQSILNAIRQFPELRVILCGVKKAYILKSQDFKDIVVMHYASYQEVDSFDDIEDQIMKISINDSHNCINNYLDQVKELLPEHTRIVTAGNQWMDISNDNINKGIAIEFLQKELQITPEECMAFGDQMNDYEMFQHVKYGIAMDNAVDAIKEIAYDICPSNDEQGVLQYIKEKVLKS